MPLSNTGIKKKPTQLIKYIHIHTYIYIYIYIYIWVYRILVSGISCSFCVHAFAIVLVAKKVNRETICFYIVFIVLCFRYAEPYIFILLSLSCILGMLKTIHIYMDFVVLHMQNYKNHTYLYGRRGFASAEL